MQNTVNSFIIYAVAFGNGTEIKMRFKRKDSLTYEEFKSPSKKYRGIPFWSWNCRIDDSKIKKQLAVFEEMGFGGAIAHSRNGLEDEYLGKRFMDGIRLATEVSKEKGLDLWLYDEDRWPSGGAGGIVTKDNLQYRLKKLLFTRKTPSELTAADGIFSRTVASFYVELDENGFMTGYRPAKDGEKCIYAHEMIAADTPRFNGGAHPDVLNDEAIKAFIDSTYVKYKNELGDDFGKTVSAIFTDEPQTSKKFLPPFSSFDNFTTATVPWTSDFPETYRERYGEDITELLPELLFELPDGKLSRARYRYHGHVAERFKKAFSEQIGDWCKENGISFTGHLLLEDTLAAQGGNVGDVTRCYNDFDIPGLDVLLANYEYVTAKQVQSVARQEGKRWIMSELYGVTTWQSDFRDYKLWGDWQAALGVTVRVPHLNWMSMLGGGKRDYPACFGYQVPWYREFSKIEDYFARLNTVLTAGEPRVRVAVIHPIESYWLRIGPNDKTGDVTKERSNAFDALSRWLLFSGIDYDYLSEELLPRQYKDGKVGEMSYQTVIIPDCITLRGSTLRILRDMKERGARIIFLGGIPSLTDGEKSFDGESLAALCEKLEFTCEAVLDALDSERSFKLFNADGVPTDRYISHTREIDGDTWLLLVPGKHIEDKESVKKSRLVLKVKGEHCVTLYNAMTGEKTVPSFTSESGETAVYLTVYSYDSILLKFSDSLDTDCTSPTPQETCTRLPAKRTWSFKREEPNVCLLDMAMYSFDGESYLPEEEVLRIDDAARKRFGLPSIMGKFAYQPWAITEDVEKDVYLRFTFNSTVETDAFLAFERITTASFNGKPVDIISCGYYVDEDFTKIALPKVQKGTNVLDVKLTVTKKYGVEPMYLLGDFDVTLIGTEKTLSEPRSRLGFTSVTEQGMPFYGGNIVYSDEIDTDDCSIEISASKYRGALIGVRLDGEEKGCIILPPYRLTVDGVKKGRHLIELTLYGNRNNTFGSLHNGIKDLYNGPEHWKKSDGEFIYEYQLCEMGIEKTPEIFVYPYKDNTEKSE